MRHRSILIVLLVFFHSFAPFGGGWEQIDNYPDIRAYWWLDWLSYAFMLESFVFISGFLFGYQVRTKGEEKLVFKSLIWGKFKRLIIPCIFFSFFYILCFKEFPNSFFLLVYDLLRGEGHMWFLPALFWCFVMVWLIEKLRIPSLITLVICSLLAICPFLPLPFQIGHTLYYLFFFYVGYLLQRNDVSLKRLESTKLTVVSCIAFLVSFFILTFLKESLNLLKGGWWYSILIPSLRNLMQIIYSSLGIIAMWCIVNRKGTVHLSSSLIAIGNMCMGVYIFQQFILKALYYHTVIPREVSPFLLPWIGFLIALLGSLALTFLFRKVKLGRFLLG